MLLERLTVASEWQLQLNSLLDNFPQAPEGQVRYILEGGAAVNLLKPGKRLIPPHDLDILSYEEALVDRLRSNNPSWHDVHTIQDWFQFRGITYSVQGDAYLRHAHVRVGWNGHEIYVLAPQALAASKLCGYRGEEPRAKDLCDVLLLGNDLNDIDFARHKLGYTRSC